MNVFIIEKSRIVRKMIAKVIQSRFGNCNIIETDNIIEAIYFLERNAVDLIICSENINNSDDNEICYSILTPKIQNTPFLLLSNQDKCINNITCVRKPISPYELEDAIRKVIKIENRRSSNRIYLTDIPVTINFILNEIQIKSKVINISKSGILLKVVYLKELYLFEEYHLEIPIINETVPACIIRMQVVDINIDAKECFVGMHFLFERVKMPIIVKNKIEKMVLDFERDFFYNIS